MIVSLIYTISRVCLGNTRGICKCVISEVDRKVSFIISQGPSCISVEAKQSAEWMNNWRVSYTHRAIPSNVPCVTVRHLPAPLSALTQWHWALFYTQQTATDVQHKVPLSSANQRRNPQRRTSLGTATPRPSCACVRGGAGDSPQEGAGQLVSGRRAHYEYVLFLFQYTRIVPLIVLLYSTAAFSIWLVKVTGSHILCSRATDCSSFQGTVPLFRGTAPLLGGLLLFLEGLLLFLGRLWRLFLFLGGLFLLLGGLFLF